jgi:hypothetical protein
LSPLDITPLDFTQPHLDMLGLLELDSLLE